DVTTPVGTTPYVVDSKMNDDFDVLVKLDGYKSETRTVKTSHTAIVSVQLTKLAATTTTTTPTTPVVAQDPVQPRVKSSTGRRGKKPTKSGGGASEALLAPKF